MELAQISFTKSRVAAINISGEFGDLDHDCRIDCDPDQRTPVPHAYASSPEIDYFRAPIMRRQQASRWKEDWEELELLVRVIGWRVSGKLPKPVGRVVARSVQ